MAPNAFCFANPALAHAQDSAVFHSGRNEYVGWWSGKNLAEMKEADPGIELIAGDVFEAACEARLTTDPKEISQERFDYFLNCLPPCCWDRRPDSESFYMSEFTDGRVTCHLVRIGAQCYSFEAVVMRSHNARVAKVTTWLESRT